MQVKAELTKAQWQIADAIARTLVLADTDVNELRKVISYLRTYVNQSQGGAKFFSYLKTLVQNGNRVGHSKRTTRYYEKIETTCSQYLAAYKDDATTMLHLLGWVARLMQYYKQAGPIAEVPAPLIQSEQQAKIQAVTQTVHFSVGQVIEAMVLAVKGNKVTYEILDTIKLTEKEPKKAASFSVGQLVKVEVVDFKEDGSLKKVKAID